MTTMELLGSEKCNLPMNHGWRGVCGFDQQASRKISMELLGDQIAFHTNVHEVGRGCKHSQPKELWSRREAEAFARRIEIGMRDTVMEAAESPTHILRKTVGMEEIWLVASKSETGKEIWRR